MWQSLEVIVHFSIREGLSDISKSIFWLQYNHFSDKVKVLVWQVLVWHILWIYFTCFHRSCQKGGREKVCVNSTWCKKETFGKARRAGPLSSNGMLGSKVFWNSNRVCHKVAPTNRQDRWVLPGIFIGLVILEAKSSHIIADKERRPKGFVCAGPYPHWHRNVWGRAAEEIFQHFNLHGVGRHGKRTARYPYAVLFEHTDGKSHGAGGYVGDGHSGPPSASDRGIGDKNLLASHCWGCDCKGTCYRQ